MIKKRWHLNFDGMCIEIFSVKPADGPMGCGSIVISHRGFAFLFSSISILVNPNFRLACSFVFLDDADGAEKGCDVFFS